MNYWTSDSISTLFSSLNSSGTSSMTSLGSDYNAIRSGSYGKLLKSFYNIDKVSENAESAKSKKSKTTLDSILEERRNPTVSEDTSKANLALAQGVSNLKDSINTLQKDSTYSTADESQTATEKTTAALKNFVSDYNNVVTNAKKSTTTRITSNVAAMMRNTTANKDTLSEIGITVNGNGTISLNEKKLQSVDPAKVQEMFSSKNLLSYGSAISSKVRGAGYYTSAAVTNSATDQNTTKQETISGATGLKNDSQALASADLYAKVKDSDGNETDKYNVDNIAKRMKSFVANYNDMLNASKSSRNSGVTSNVEYIKNKTANRADSLQKIGVTINTDGRLSLDEDKFKNANMEDVRSLFKDYGSSIATNASLVSYYMNTQANATNGYTSNAAYNVPASASYVSSI